MMDGRPEVVHRWSLISCHCERLFTSTFQLSPTKIYSSQKINKIISNPFELRINKYCINEISSRSFKGRRGLLLFLFLVEWSRNTEYTSRWVIGNVSNVV